MIGFAVAVLTLGILAETLIRFAVRLDDRREQAMRARLLGRPDGLFPFEVRSRG